MQQYAAGVLVAQVAVEMGALNAFTALLVRLYGPLDDERLREYLPDVSLMDERTRRLWTQLTGQRVTRPKGPPVWANYHAHVEYRNRIAHGTSWATARAGRASRRQASSSFALTSTCRPSTAPTRTTERAVTVGRFLRSECEGSARPGCWRYMAQSSPGLTSHAPSTLAAQGMAAPITIRVPIVWARVSRAPVSP
jgi:hypothetical protein